MEKDQNPPARLVSQKQVFARYHTLEVVQAEPRSLKDGSYLPPLEREMLRTGTASAILLYCPETDEVLLNQQFRMGAFFAGDADPFLFEVAAGAIDDGETPIEAARREGLEETGCEVLDLEPMCSFYTSPGILDEVIYLHVGRIARPETGFHGVAAESEEIKTHLVSTEKLFAMLDDGTIRNATSMIAVQWFHRHHTRLKKKWTAA